MGSSPVRLQHLADVVADFTDGEVERRVVWRAPLSTV